MSTDNGGTLINEDTILVVGSGAMACLVAARLIGAGLPVVMLGGWPDGVDAIRRYGIRVVQPHGGGEQAYPAQVTEDPRDCTGVRYAIVLVKSWQTDHAAQQISACL